MNKKFESINIGKVSNKKNSFKFKLIDRDINASINIYDFCNKLDLVSPFVLKKVVLLLSRIIDFYETEP